MRKINECIIHCADTPDDKDFSVKDIDNWHKQRGFNKHGSHTMYCGYHYVITRNGIIEKGRLLNEIGAHCRGYNLTSVGICLIGRNNFTNKQWSALRRLMYELELLFPGIEFCGHNEFSNKTCPNFNVKQEILKGKLNGYHQ